MSMRAFVDRRANLERRLFRARSSLGLIAVLAGCLGLAQPNLAVAVDTVVTLQAGAVTQAPPPKATISVSPTRITAGGSAILSWSTTNPATVSINQGIGVVLGSGSLTISPTTTTTYTITATGQSRSVTQSTTLSVDPISPFESYFAVGSGFTDVVPHQIVRTATDQLYLFAGQAFSSILKAQWTSNSGLPSSGTDFGGAAQVTLAANPISISPAYDGASTVHVVANLQDGSVIDVPFDLTTNSFRSASALTTVAGTVSGDYLGSSGVTSMVDVTGYLHVAYWTSGNQILHAAYSYNSSSNQLSQVSAPTRVDTAGPSHHPSLAVSPLDNSVTVAWVSLATTPKQILARVRDVSGGWTAVQNVSNTAIDVWTSTSGGVDIDQGPSLIITNDGIKHLAYIENYDSSGDYGAIHYVSNNGGGWTDLELTATYTHDPALAANALGELYIIGHGHPNDASQACKSEDDLCVTKRNTDGSWGSSTLFARHTTGNSFDSSPSVKWSVVGWTRPETIEFLFFQTPYSTPIMFYGRIQSTCCSIYRIQH